MSESQASSSATSVGPTASSTAPRGPWLFHPVIDVVVGCGLCALPLALLSDWASGRLASTALVIAAALSLFVNGPHYAATAVRAWRLGGRHRTILIAATVALIVAAVVAHALPALLPWLFTAYLTWSPWHYATQNHGIGLLLLARDQAHASTTTNTTNTTSTTSTTNTMNTAKAMAPTQNERRGLKLAHVLFALAAVVATHAGPREPLVVRAGWSTQVAFVVGAVALIAGALLSTSVLWRLKKRGAPVRGLLLLLALLSTSLVWFVVPAMLARGGLLLYAGGVVALLHSGQYLWITSFVEGRSAHVERRSFDGFAWTGLVIALGVLMFSVVPWATSRALGYDLVISLLIVQALVNLHHFVVDAAIWKMRDPVVRAPIFSGHERAPAARHLVSNKTALLWSVPAILLVLLGVLDVIQLAGTRSDASEPLALRAIVLNENDSRVWVQSAQAAVAAGDVDSARADLGRAIALSPYNADAQRALARLHVAAGRDDEAWARFQAMPAGLADDPDSLVLFSGVALRLGKLDEAIALGRRAQVALEDVITLSAVEARRTIGVALLTQKKPGEAKAELQRGLDDAQAALGHDPLPKGQLLELGLALADANVELQQHDPALVLYERCLQGAVVAGRPDVAFHALTARARVQLARGRPTEALDSFQRALRFVDDVTDPFAISAAWLDYAALLARSDAPMRVRYACGLKARAAAERMPRGPVKDERLAFITEATRYVEEVLTPADAEAVRKDVDAAARDALTLSYPDDDAAGEAPGAAADDAGGDGAPPPALQP